MMKAQRKRVGWRSPLALVGLTAFVSLVTLYQGGRSEQ